MANRRQGNPIPRPPPGQDLKCNTSKPYHADDTCFPTDSLHAQDWSLDQVFGKTIRGTCPLTDSSVPPVCLQVPHSRHVFTSADVEEIKEPGNEFQRCYRTPADQEFNLVLPLQPRDGDKAKADADEFVQPETPLLYAERSLTGHGFERGGIQTIFTNPSPDAEVEFVYMESLPWFMRIYLHTLQARISHSAGSDAGAALRQKNDVIQDIYYRPFLDRERGTQLEVRVKIPPGSTVFMTYDLEKTILRYTEYPPDANRGFDVAAAVITILPGHAANGHQLGKTSHLRTTTVLLSLPTPDFSMPYNVIIFTSTAIALAFGGLYNILVRRFVGRDEGPEVTLVRLRRKIQERVQALKGRVQGKTGAPAKGARAPGKQD